MLPSGGTFDLIQLKPHQNVLAAPTVPHGTIFCPAKMKVGLRDPQEQLVVIRLNHFHSRSHHFKHYFFFISSIVIIIIIISKMKLHTHIKHIE